MVLTANLAWEGKILIARFRFAKLYNWHHVAIVEWRLWRKPEWHRRNCRCVEAIFVPSYLSVFLNLYVGMWVQQVGMSPTEHITTFKPQNQLINQFYDVHKGRSADFKAIARRNAWSRIKLNEGKKCDVIRLKNQLLLVSSTIIIHIAKKIPG